MGRRSVALAGACLLVAVGGGGAIARARQSRRTRTGDQVMAVTERDFEISAPARAKPGVLVLRVHNEGPDRHEVIVVRRPNGGSLPLRADGMTVDEEGLQASTVGALEPRTPHTVNDLRLHLGPGTYELFCNMSGHYLGGMHSELVVG